MEVLAKTQFSGAISPKFRDIDPFIVKKLEEAIMKGYEKKYMGKVLLEEKLQKAQKRREEQMKTMINKLTKRNQHLE